MGELVFTSQVHHIYITRLFKLIVNMNNTKNLNTISQFH
uniref:Uncharacterized protein n=1 Tax=Anguilla anguilla TaxID=7936 RepID=A0A0E9U9Z0_ANGAN